MHRPRTRNLLRIAGLSTWLLSGIPAGALVVGRDLPALSLVVWMAAFGVYGVLFWKTSGMITERGADRGAVPLLAAQVLAVVAMFAIICSGLEAMLMVMIAAQVGLLIEPRRALLWIMGQTVLISIACYFHWQALSTLYFVLATLSVEMLAFLIALMAGGEARARDELARTIAELEATRGLLADSSRNAERLRIARELHDVVGHHLTALTLNLEAAQHTERESYREAVGRARDIAKELLADVRETVSELREDEPLDVRQAIEHLVATIPVPAIHLEIAPDLRVEDPERALAVVRCVQEMITNAARHASANHLWITLEENDGRVVVQARDDGRPGNETRIGNGIRGMGERVEALGGKLEIERGPQGGFGVRAIIPLETPA